MTQGFDEHWDKWCISSNCEEDEALTHFEEGAASRQAEIDSLRIELDGANERAVMTLNHKNKMVDKMQAEIDELQKRINDSLDYVFGLYCTGDLDTERLENILKGESND